MLDAAAPRALPSRQQDTGPASFSVPTPSGSRLGSRWFVVSTYPQAERRAAHHLTQQAYEVYLPLVTVTRRDRALRTLTHRVEVPLFASYLFVRLDVRDPWRPITNTPGVFKLLMNACLRPEPVPDAQIHALQATDDARRCQVADSHQWAPGALCSLRRGYAFEGLPAVITAISHDTADIAIMMLGQLRNLSVSIECLVARDDG